MKTLLDQCGLDPRIPILVGVSGGPDSLCLLDVLHSNGFQVIVAHFNHRLRPQAEGESAAVAELARSLGLPYVSDSADVRGYSLENHLSLEEAARLLRYRFLFDASREHSAQAVAVGHTADDQAETVLMHFLRGAGLAGLRGMEPRTFLSSFDPNIPLVRPLLSAWRAETEAYCREKGLQPHFDASNADPAFLRNRIRRELIPALESYNPRLKESLLRTAAALQGDFALLQESVDVTWEQVFAASGEGWLSFDAPALSRCSTPMRNNLLRRAANLLRPSGADISFESLQRACAFLDSPTARQADFENGLYLLREMGRVFLAAYEADLPAAQFPQVEAPLEPGLGSCRLGSGWVLTLEILDSLPLDFSFPSDNWTAFLDADALPPGALLLRPPAPGDRFQPLGMETGTVKLSDFFINNKLPRRARRKYPLLCSAGQILWIPGFRPAQPFRLTASTRRILRLSLHKS